MQFERTLFIAGTFMLTGFLSCGNKEVKTETVIPEVNVVTAGQLTVPVYTEYVGQTLGIADVEIRSRVEGWIVSIHFKEGDQVKKGQLLYVIDDLPIRSRVDAAEGRVAEARTQMVRTKSDLDRVEPLAKMNALSQRDLDAAKANYEASRSQLEVANAQLRTAKIELGYTRITSPITGVIGISSALVGDYVNQGGIGKTLNTVSALGDVRVRFPISETEYLRFAKRIRGNKDKIQKVMEIPVQLILGDDSMYPEYGKIDLINRQVDPKTGSMLMQALFKNDQNLIRPGEYVKVRFQTDEYKDAVMVPQQAINQLQSVYQVYVVNDSSKVVPRVVQTGARVGSNWIISSGLKAGEKVAVIGNAVVNPKNPIKQNPMNWNYDSTIRN
jgi:membrane fusion protein (multidrug efflux system)